MHGYQTNGLVSPVNEETALPATEDLLVYQLIAAEHLPDTGKDEQERKNRPTFAAMKVDRFMFPVIAHTMARKTRPPSSGYPGIRLNSTKAILM